jgi:ATP-dependent RNA helicase RhlE
MKFSDLGLSAEIQRAIAEQGYDTPTPIQQQAIPVVLAGRDLMACAQTGTGKTAGFTLPILKLLQGKRARPKQPRVLVLTPTRELAMQVEESVRTYGKHLPLTSLAVFGGVGMNPQVQALARGIDILVATPGRLMDHMQQKTVDLSAVEILVLDEADRMLDMGFIRDIRKILAVMPKQKQSLLFSATFSDDIRELAQSFLHNP